MGNTTLLRLVFAGNVLIPTGVGLTHLLAPQTAADLLWAGLVAPSEATFKMFGAIWTTVGLLSIVALLTDPVRFR